MFVYLFAEEGMKWNEFIDKECVHLQFGHKTKGFRGKVKDLQIATKAFPARLAIEM